MDNTEEPSRGRILWELKYSGGFTFILFTRLWMGKFFTEKLLLRQAWGRDVDRGVAALQTTSSTAVMPSFARKPLAIDGIMHYRSHGGCRIRNTEETCFGCLLREVYYLLLLNTFVVVS